MAPLCVSAAGWISQGSNPEDRDRSSHNLMFGRDNKGEIGRARRTALNRIAAWVNVVRGKFEARFDWRIWVGKSEFDNTLFVVVRHGEMSHVVIGVPQTSPPAILPRQLVELQLEG